jgi:hypothetical protein
LPENQYAIRLIDPPSRAIARRRIAISESVLSDFNGLRRHSRVIESLHTQAPGASRDCGHTGPAAAVLAAAEPFKRLRAKACHNHQSHSCCS